MYCQNCGKKLNDEAKFCDGCGTKTGTAPAEAAPATKHATASSIVPRKTPMGGLVANIAALLVAGYFTLSMFLTYAISTDAYVIAAVQLLAILSTAAGFFFYYLRTPSKNAATVEAIFVAISLVFGLIHIAGVSANYSYVGFGFYLTVVGGAVLAAVATGINIAVVRLHGSKSETRWGFGMYATIILIGFLVAFLLPIPLVMH